MCVMFIWNMFRNPKKIAFQIISSFILSCRYLKKVHIWVGIYWANSEHIFYSNFSIKERFFSSLFGQIRTRILEIVNFIILNIKLIMWADNPTSVNAVFMCLKMKEKTPKKKKAIHFTNYIFLNSIIICLFYINIIIVHN